MAFSSDQLGGALKIRLLSGDHAPIKDSQPPCEMLLSQGLSFLIPYAPFIPLSKDNEIQPYLEQFISADLKGILPDTTPLLQNSFELHWDGSTSEVSVQFDSPQWVHLANIKIVQPDQFATSANRTGRFIPSFICSMRSNVERVKYVMSRRLPKIPAIGPHQFLVGKRHLTLPLVLLNATYSVIEQKATYSTHFMGVTYGSTMDMRAESSVAPVMGFHSSGESSSGNSSPRSSQED